MSFRSTRHSTTDPIPSITLPAEIVSAIHPFLCLCACMGPEMAQEKLHMCTMKMVFVCMGASIQFYESKKTSHA